MTTRRALFSVCTTIISSYFLILGSAQAISFDGTPPTAPTNVKAVAHTANTSPQVVISWNQAMDNIGVTRYNIYRNGTFLFSPQGVGVTYTDSTVTAGQTYTYSIQAGDGDGNNSPQSDTIAITVNEGEVSKVVAAPSDTSAPSPVTSVQQVTSVYTNTSMNNGTAQVDHPENVSMVPYEDRLEITWKNPVGNKFKSVRVIKKESSYPLSSTDGKVICDSLTVTQCLDREVISGKVYYYGVYAVDQSYLASKLITLAGSVLEKKAQVTIPVKIVHMPVFVPTTSQLVAGNPPFTRMLRVGSSGQDVLLLQQFLNGQNFLIASTGTGSKGYETTYFGRATEKALRAYQCQKKIVCDGNADSTGYGMVGKTTRFNLNKDSLTVATH